MRNAATISANSSTSSDRTLWLAVFVTLCAGAVVVYSSSYIFAQERFGDGLYFFKKHLLFSGFGAVAFLFGWRLPTEILRRSTTPLFFLAIALLLLTLVPGIGTQAGGARRWLSFAGISLQPSELVKVVSILWLARQIERKIDEQSNWRTGLLTYFAALIPIAVLLLRQPDFGSVGLILCTTLLVIFSVGVRWQYIAGAVLATIPIIVGLIASSAYRRNRFLGFIDPWSDPARKGFQIIQSLLAFYTGHWFGVGLGNSREKLFYLPEAHNDFIFSVVGEELGLFGVCFFVVLFSLIVHRGLRIAQRLDGIYEKALATGISSMLGLQAFFNMAVVLGLLPTKGMPLPLISYGGTALIANLFALGILSRLSEKTS